MNNRRAGQYSKRHAGHQWVNGQAANAVDGDVSANDLKSCTILDNFYVDRPTWMVDLGKKSVVSGVVIYTRQSPSGAFGPTQGGAGGNDTALSKIDKG